MTEDIFLESIINSVNIGYLCLKKNLSINNNNSEFEIIEYNSKFKSIFFLNKEEINFADFNEFQSDINWISILNEIYETKNHKNFIFLNKKTKLTYNTTLNLIDNDFIVILFDEISYSSGDEILYSLISSIYDLIIFSDKEYKILKIYSSKEEKIFFDKEETSGKKINSIFPSTLSDLFESVISKVISTKKAETFEYIFSLQNTVKFWKAYIMPFFNHSTKTYDTIILISDITDKKILENEYYQNRRMLKILFEQNILGISFINKDSKYVMVNKKFCSITGYTEEELLNMSIFDLTCPEDIPQDRLYIKELFLNKREFYDRQKRYIKKNGDLVNIRILVSPIKDENGRIVNFVGFTEDITEKIKDEAKLPKIKTNQETENLNLFLSMNKKLGTELKQIIDCINNFSDKESSNIQQFLASINYKTGNSLEYINNFSYYYKLKTGILRVISDEFDINSLFDYINNAFVYSASEKGIKLIIENNCFQDNKFNSDYNIIKHILFNILDNSVKYTSSGEIRILANKTFSNNTPYLTFIIKDTGNGFSKEFQELFFEISSKNELTIKKEFDYSGLGLILTRKLTDLLNGHIKINTIQGIGTTFYIQIPFLSDNQAVNQNGSEIPNNTNIRLLLIEENELNRFIIVQSAKKKKWNIDTSLTYKDGIELLYNNDYDMVFINIQMTESNVMDVVKQIRNSNKKELRKIPIIGLSTFVLKNFKDEAFRSGITDFLFKPFSIGDFYKITETYYNK